MEKFDSFKYSFDIKKLPFSYYSLLIYLDFIAYFFKRNDENLIVWQDIIYPHDFPSIFIPKKNKNWEYASIALASNEDVEKIRNENIEIKVQLPVEIEYFYKTENFFDPKKGMRTHIENFKKLYSYIILNEYPFDRILEFYIQWKKQRDRNSITVEEEEKFFMFCLNNLDKYHIKQIYVEIDNRLVGFAWGIKHSENNWAGLELKVDYSYKGLSRFLQSERAKIFSDYKFFTLGTGCHDEGIIKYKKELGPSFVKKYHYLLTGNKLGK